MSNKSFVTVQAGIKPWTKSKIVLMALSLVLVVGGGFLASFLASAGVTKEQLDVLFQVNPEIAKIVQAVQSGKSLLEIVGVITSSLFGLGIAIARIWFTREIIPQSLPAKAE